MKNVLSTGITSSSQQPYTKTTHEWYNAMSKDVAEAFVKSLIPSSAYTGKLVILSGCKLTGTNPGARTVSDGWVWYSGEIFRVNAGTFTTGVGEVGVWSINTVATNLTFSDGASKPVHQEKTLVLSNGESGSQLFDENSVNVTSIPVLYVQNPDRIITKSVAIGTWNMDTTSTLSVDLSSFIVDTTKIVSLSCVIFQDDGKAINLESPDSTTFDSQGCIGFVSESTKITALFRKTGGSFDTGDFSASGNRGYLVVKYLP